MTVATPQQPRFRPQPAQRTFLSSSADLAIYGGSAGGGKSWALLYDPLKHIQKAGFNGVIFRRSYPEITNPGGLWDEAAEVYPQAGGRGVVGMHEYRWPRYGSKIAFRHLEHADSVHDYQGSQICCEESTEIRMGDGSLCPLREIRVGDWVATLEGARRVVRVGQRRFEQCVTATVYDEEGRLIGCQTHSETHAILSPSGWVSYADIADELRLSWSSWSTRYLRGHRSASPSSSRSRTVEQSPDTPSWDQPLPYEATWRPRGHRSGSGVSVCEVPQDRGSGCVESGYAHEARRQRLSVIVPVMLPRPSPGSGGPFGSRLVRGHGVCGDHSGSSPGGCSDRCSEDCDPCDGRSLREPGSRQSFAQQRVGVEPRIPTHCSSDGLHQARKCTSPSSQYVHPYTRDIRRTAVPLAEGTCELTPCGGQWVIDVTVEEVSHYCTKTGLANKNCFLAFDELTHFTESQFWYLLSRNRSTCGVRPYVRATCNPDPGWVKDLLAPWVDDSFAGRRAASAELRWFVRVGGAIRWVDQGHPDAKSMTFVRATVYDNHELLSKNPEYLANLKALPDVERKRLLDGDWNVRREGLVYSGFEGCLVESGPPSTPTVGGVDFGFNHPFAAVWGHLDDDVLWITGVRYRRETTTPVHAEALPKSVRWWCDPSRPDTIKELRNLGHSEAVPCVHMSVRGGAGGPRTPVLYGIDLVTQRMRTGRLKIVREACLPLVRELSTYCYDPERMTEEPVKEDDHACDALRYLIVGLDRGKAKPEPELKVGPNLDDPGLWGG